MRRKFLFLSFLFICFFHSWPVFANDKFSTTHEISYFLKENNRVATTHKISLTNLLPDVFPTEYYFETESIDLENVAASDRLGPIKPQIENTGDKVKISFKFNERVVGQNKTLNFEISYDLLGVMVKNGEVWEVNLPHFPATDNLTQGLLILAAPLSFGSPAYITPSTYEFRTDSHWNYYVFRQETVGDSTVSAVFGLFQIFDFEHDYHLYNPRSSEGDIWIAFPPDTAFQRIYLEKITPQPEQMEIDIDGNWLGLYILKPFERLKVTAVGWAKIFTKPWDLPTQPDPQLSETWLAAQKYWEVDHPELVAQAQKLGTAKKIYDFVVNHLDYDYTKIEEETKRMGALAALREPEHSICMEFTDLFVTLSRAAGIPAREVNGYAYTTNSRLRPLSLISDILHSWPEYWHEEKKIWVPVDPTWGKTTGGRDYFAKLDLNHFAFVIHGQSSQEPLSPGSYKTEEDSGKDIKVEFGQYQPVKQKDFRVNFSFIQTPGQKIKLPKAIIKNPGPAAAYQVKLNLDAKAVKLAPDFQKEQVIEVILPYGQVEIPIKLQRPGLWQFGSAGLILNVDQKVFLFPFRVETLIWPQLLLNFTGLLLGVLAALSLIWLTKKIAKRLIR